MHLAMNDYWYYPGSDDPTIRRQPTPRQAPTRRAQPASPEREKRDSRRSQKPSVPKPPFPPRKKKRQKRKGRRFFGCLLRIGLAGALFSVVFTVLLAILYVVAPPPRTNILLLGIDARSGEGVATRTDTVMLVTIDPADLYVGVLSIPRDLYLNIPGYGFNRINAAHVLGENAYTGGGPELAAETIEANFGIRVHRTVRVNFDAFTSIVDAAGGVNVNVENYIIDYEYPTPDYGTMVIEFQEGEQTLNGERALQYARTRHSGSDFDRAARQQQVVEGLVKKLISPWNWWRLPVVYYAFSQHVTTDTTIIDAMLLGPTVLWVETVGEVDYRVLNPQMAVGTTTSAGASVLEPQWGQINPLVEEMFRQ